MILLADIASFYPLESPAIMKPQYIMEQLQILNRYNNDDHLSIEIAYIKKQFRIDWTTVSYQ